MQRLIVAGMPAMGHVNPSLPVVAELVRRGVAVVHYASEEFRPAVEHAGAQFRPYPPGALESRDIAEATQSGSSVRVVTRILRATERLLPLVVDDVRAAPANTAPDAIAFDSNAVWGRMAAGTLKLPTISLMTTCLLGTDFKILTPREWLHVVRLSLPDVPGTLRARRRLVRLAGRDALPPSPMLPMRGDVTIFPIPRWLQPDNPLLDERCHFVGPTAEVPSASAASPGVAAGLGDDAELAAALDGPEPVVLVSLGTLHRGTDAFFRACFEALADVRARFVIVTGTQSDPVHLGVPPANTTVRRSVPQVSVLRRAAAFVTHGGMNSVMEGLVCGVPLVVVPQQVEQLLIGRTVAQRGAGIVLRHNVSGRDVPARSLLAAVDRALWEPSLRRDAQALSESLRSGGGARAAADAIEHLLADSRDPSA